MIPVGLAALATVLPACSSTPPPEAAPAATSTPVAEPAPAPSARILKVEPSRENFRDARVKILFSNPGPKTCRFLGYTLLWGSWSKEIKLKNLSIPAGQTRERWIKVDSDHGDTSELTEKSARVEVSTECGD